MFEIIMLGGFLSAGTKLALDKKYPNKETYTWSEVQSAMVEATSNLMLDLSKAEKQQKEDSNKSAEELINTGLDKLNKEE